MKKTGCFALMLLWLCVLFALKPWDDLKKYVVQSQGQTESSMVFGQSYVEQFFTSDQSFDAVDLYIDNYNHTYEGRFFVKIYDMAGNCIYSKSVNKTELGNGWLECRLGHKIEHRLHEPAKYKIEITAPELEKENCVVVYHADTAADDIRLMYDAGIKKDQTICFSVYCVQKNIFAYLSLAVFLLTITVWWVNRKKSILCVSAIVLVGMGICMLVLMAPFSQPDEDYHYNSALALSNILMGQENVYEFPEEYYDLSGIQVHYNANTAYLRVIQEFFAGKQKHGTIFFDGNRINGLYHPVIYLAPALGITLGRILGLSFIFTHYLGRLFQLALYILMALAAIKIMPKKKELLLFIAALPMSLHQAASYSYDVVTNGMSFLLIAYILKLLYQKTKIAWKNLLLLMAIGSILCPNKLIYSVLMLLIFMIPKEKFLHAKRYKHQLMILLLAAFGVVVVTQFPVILNLTKGTTPTEYVRYYSMRYAFSHLGAYIRTVCVSIQQDIIFWVTRLGIGSHLAGLTLPISEYLIFGFLILLVISSYRKEEYTDTQLLCAWQKKICIVTVVLGVISIVCALSTDTLYGGQTIVGVQGRYFIPFYLPFLLGIHTSRVSVETESSKLLFIYWLLQAGVMNVILSSVAF